MDAKLKEALFKAVRKEPFAQAFNITLKELDLGYSVVEMKYDPDRMDNIYQSAHGGALFGLIDEAFETACQTEGTIAVALNMNVTYVASPMAGARLRAVARQISQTKKTASFDIKVTDETGALIASCSALAYRTGKPIPFL
jgi:acyl-CoA thioesterase